MQRCRWLGFAIALFALTVVPAVALAARSGASFGGRSGFRSSSGAFSRSYSYGRRGYGGGNVVILPGLGWGWGGGGFGLGGGMGLFGTLAMLAIVGAGSALLVRAVRRAQRVWEPAGDDDGWWSDRDPEAQAPSRAYVSCLQLGLGRSARAIRQRLAEFAAQGDTASDLGLARLLQQTALELLREQDSVRYGAIEATRGMSLTNAETKMNALALAERSRFQIERIRSADGQVRRAGAATTESQEALEVFVVTLVIASREPLAVANSVLDRAALEAMLKRFGALAPSALLGLEVIWTPADPDDALTEADLLGTYPELRSL